MNPVQPENTSYETVVTLFGIVNEPVNPVQSLKALKSIVSRFEGRFKLPVNVDPEKAVDLMVVRDWGRLSWPEKFVYWKERDPIVTRFAGRVNDPEQPRLENVWSSITVS